MMGNPFVDPRPMGPQVTGISIEAMIEHVAVASLDSANKLSLRGTTEAKAVEGFDGLRGALARIVELIEAAKRDGEGQTSA